MPPSISQTGSLSEQSQPEDSWCLKPPECRALGGTGRGPSIDWGDLLAQIRYNREFLRPISDMVVQFWATYMENRAVTIFCRMLRFFPNFFPIKLVYFWTNHKKIYMCVFSTHFVPLISILAPKIMEKWNIQLCDFCKLLRLPASPILKIQKFPLGMLILMQKPF